MEVFDDLLLGKIVSSLKTGTTAETDEVINRFLDLEGGCNWLLDDDASIDSTAELLLGIDELVERSSSTAATTCPLFHADHPRQHPLQLLRFERKQDVCTSEESNRIVCGGQNIYPTKIAQS
jgi:hypothetical protein